VAETIGGVRTALWRALTQVAIIHCLEEEFPALLREIIQPSMTLRPDRLFSLFTFLAVRPAPVTVCLAEIHATCLIPGSNLFSGSFQSQQKLLQAL